MIRGGPDCVARDAESAGTGSEPEEHSKVRAAFSSAVPGRARRTSVMRGSEIKLSCRASHRPHVRQIAAGRINAESMRDAGIHFWLGHVSPRLRLAALRVEAIGEH